MSHKVSHTRFFAQSFGFSEEETTIIVAYINLYLQKRFGGSGDFDVVSPEKFREQFTWSLPNGSRIGDPVGLLGCMFAVSREHIYPVLVKRIPIRLWARWDARLLGSCMNPTVRKYIACLQSLVLEERILVRFWAQWDKKWLDSCTNPTVRKYIARLQLK
ncbi:MAG: hypothetical protein EAY65_04650 [Alphaproteobacteria bacterium]|nr:MAG: hypothetical protein EAY65_04650 [Alphaproteobacteria bacterium]